MKPLFLALCVVTLAACSDDATSGTEAASAAGPTDVNAAADAYLAAYPVSDLMGDMTDAIAETVPPAQRAQFENALGRVNTDTLEAAMRRSLVRNFTAAEMNALTALYSSPEGRSVMSKMPAYTADVMPAIQQEIVRAVGETMGQTP